MPELSGKETIRPIKESSYLVDRFGRSMRYLRVSLTDRCNFRCTYCRPNNDEVKSHDDLLTFEELYRVVRIMAGLGIDKVRLTGGEPLVRKGADHLVRMLSGIEGIKDLAMTTNAVLLVKYAKRLAEAGLNRLNISLDSLDAKRFERLTSGGDLSAVLRGIEAASAEGIRPIKLNTVLMRGFNDDELPALIDYASLNGYTIRFIEFMPVTDGLDWESSYISVDEVLAMPGIIERVDTSAAPMASGSASFYLPLRSGGGEVGFIPPMSNKFCDNCNRLRITADGRIRACLPSDSDVDLRDALRSGALDAELISLIQKVVSLKPETGDYSHEGAERKRSMVEIGG